MKKTKFEKNTGIELDHYNPKKSIEFKTFLHIVKNCGYTLDDAITFYGIFACVQDGMTIELYNKITKGRK